jgi:hypothetical protein
LRALDRVLAPGGTLIVCTGNADAPPCRRDVGGFWYFRNVEHLVMIDDAIARRGAHLGYRIAEWRETSHYAMPLGKRSASMCGTRRTGIPQGGERGADPRRVPVVNRRAAGRCRRRWSARRPRVVRFEKARPGGANA